MTVWYVDSVAGDDTTGATWPHAFATLTKGFTNALAGDTIYISSTSAETLGAGKAMTSAGTAASPVLCYSVNKAGSFPPVAADILSGATVTTTGSFAITFTGYTHFYGITFNCGTTGTQTFGILNSSANGMVKFDTCGLWNLSTGTSTNQYGPNSSTAFKCKIELVNTTLKFASVNQSLQIEGVDFIWRDGGLAAGTSVPTNLFSTALHSAGTVLVEGCDLSLATGTLVGATAVAKRFIFKKCKINPTTVSTVPTEPGAGETVIENCDSGTNIPRTEKNSYQGLETTELTVVRTGGATDGTTPIARKLALTANTSRQFPYEMLPMSIMNTVVGAVTVTVYGIAASIPTNANCWMEVEYLGTSGNPLGLRIVTAPVVSGTQTINYLDNGSANTTDSVSTWGGSTAAFSMAASITTTFVGAINVYVKIGSNSVTPIYIDPRIFLS